MFIVSKLTFEKFILYKLHFAFIRPIFEISSVFCRTQQQNIFTNIFTNIYLLLWKKLQITATRVVTDTNLLISKHLLYNDTGWDQLQLKGKNNGYYIFQDRQ